MTSITNQQLTELLNRSINSEPLFLHGRGYQGIIENYQPGLHLQVIGFTGNQAGNENKWCIRRLDNRQLIYIDQPD